MSRAGRVAIAVAVVATLALWTWRSQLFVVSRPGEAPRPLVVRAATLRPSADLDVVLPAVPVGMAHLGRGNGVLLIHYWAPWERDGASQAALLDSLSHLDGFGDLHVALVCFDPFPSVARYVARRRLRLRVLLDHDHELRRVLPCPSVPYTYVLDRDGRIAVAQAGEVDWLNTATLDGLRRLSVEPTARELAPRGAPAPS